VSTSSRAANPGAECQSGDLNDEKLINFSVDPTTTDL
jgi:hypothetical protein